MANTFVPLLVAVPMRLNADAPFEDNPRDVGERLDVVDARRRVPQPLDRRERRPHARHAAPSLDRSDQRRLLAAHEGARALLQPDVKRKAAAEDVVAEQAPLLRLRDGDGQPLDGLGVLGPHVDVPVRRPDREARDRHPLEDGVRVALEHRPVHERARVPLVRVADDVLAWPPPPAA